MLPEYLFLDNIAGSVRSHPWSHSELVGWGGLGFDNQEEISTLLNTVVEKYSGFQNLIHVNTIRDVGNTYVKIMNLVSDEKSSFVLNKIHMILSELRKWKRKMNI